MNKMTIASASSSQQSRRLKEILHELRADEEETKQGLTQICDMLSSQICDMLSKEDSQTRPSQSRMVRSKERLCMVEMWEPDQRILQALEGTGLEHLYSLAKATGRNQHSNKMLEAIINRYDSKEQCIKLGRGDAISIYFGLEDVLYITGLKVDGDLVLIDKDIKAVEMGEGFWVDGLGTFSKEDFPVKDKERRSSISLTLLRKKFMTVQSEEDLTHQFNAYVLYLIGTAILPTGNDRVSLSYLRAIVDGKVKEKAWGVAMLSHVHLNLGKKKKNIGGGMYFLTIWALERLQPVLKLFFGDYYGTEPHHLVCATKKPSQVPLYTSWAHLTSEVLKNKRHDDLIGYLPCLLDITVDDIIMQPYKRLGEEVIPQYITEQLWMRRFRGTLMHPMHYNSPIINHRPEICPQQLGVERVTAETKDHPFVEAKRRRTYFSFENHWKIRSQRLVTLHGEPGSENTCLQGSSTSTCISLNSKSLEPNVELNCLQKTKKKKRKTCETLESNDKCPDPESDNLCLETSRALCKNTNTESLVENVENNNSKVGKLCPESSATICTMQNRRKRRRKCVKPLRAMI